MKKFPLICWMCDCSIAVLLTRIDSALTTRWGPNILLQSILLRLIVHLTFSTHEREGCSSHYSVCLPVCLSCFDFGDNRQFADDLGMKLLRTMRLLLFKNWAGFWKKAKLSARHMYLAFVGNALYSHVTITWTI